MEKKPDIGFREILLYIFKGKKVIITIGRFPIGQDSSEGICFLEVDSDTMETGVIVDYNFGLRKLLLKP